MPTQAPEGSRERRRQTHGVVFSTSRGAVAYGSWPRRAPRARSPTCVDPLASTHATPRRRQRDGLPQRPEAARRTLKGRPARSGASQGEGGPAACFRPGAPRAPERHEEAGRAAELRVARGERLSHHRLAARACRVSEGGAGVKGVPEARSLIEARRVPRRGRSIGEQLGPSPDGGRAEERAQWVGESVVASSLQPTTDSLTEARAQQQERVV